MEPTPEELQAWYDSLPEMPYEQMKREKEEARVRDWERIARGEATPEQIQRENQIFTTEQLQGLRIVNLEEMLSKMK